MKNQIDLLYPSSKGKTETKLSSEVLDSLELNGVLSLRFSRLCDYFTDDIEVIEYRQKVIKDVAKNPKLCDLFERLRPILNDISEVRSLSGEQDSVDRYLYGITEIELYLSTMELLKTELLPLKDTFESTALQDFCQVVSELTESDYYRDLNEKLKELSQKIGEAKSVTIGVNLDNAHRPESAGVISVNNEPFKSGKTIQKILRFDFKNDDYTCICDLTPFRKNQTENQQSALTYALNNALNEVYKSSMGAWKKIVSEYVLENADFLIRLMPEIEFLTESVKMIQAVEKTGNPLCYPTLKPQGEKVFQAKDIYNVSVALKLQKELVKNDFSFDEKGRFYVLSGPNRGGKSVITVAVGQAFALCGLGLPVPCQSATISPVDRIFTHFPTESEDTIDKGRLGEECARLDEIFDQITENSLVLLDETLSSTGSYEASFIASDVLRGFSLCGCRGIFSTHLHELATMIDKINDELQEKKHSAIDTLVAEIENGERNFKISRCQPNGQSYAKDIADKYGISMERIMKKISKK